MRRKITLYTSRDEKLAKITARKARQFIRQHRGVWTDDHKTAIRLAPGEENLKDIMVIISYQTHQMTMPYHLGI